MTGFCDCLFNCALEISILAYLLMGYVAVSRYLDNGIGSEPVGKQRVFNQAIMDQLIAAINECKQPGKNYGCTVDYCQMLFN